MSEKELTELLYRCHPFLIHSLCTIPKDNREYKDAVALVEEVNTVLYGDIDKLLTKHSNNKEQSK